MTICTQMSTFKHYSMTELEKKALNQALDLLKSFSYGNIYSALDNILTKYELDAYDKASIKQNLSYAIDKEGDKINDAKAWITTFEPYYFVAESVQGKIKYLIYLAKKNYGYRNVFKDFDKRYLILVKQEIDGFPVEVTPFSILEDVLNQYNLYKQYHGSNSSQTT